MDIYKELKRYSHLTYKFKFFNYRHLKLSVRSDKVITCLVKWDLILLSDDLESIFPKILLRKLYIILYLWSKSSDKKGVRGRFLLEFKLYHK